MSELTNTIYHALGKELHPASQSHWEKLSKYWLCNRLIKAANEIEQFEAEIVELKQRIGIMPESWYTQKGLEAHCELRDRKIADLQAEKESLEVQIMYALEKLDKFVASIKQALKGNK